jgi:hypothetical protein
MDSSVLTQLLLIIRRYWGNTIKKNLVDDFGRTIKTKSRLVKYKGIIKIERNLIYYGDYGDTLVGGSLVPAYGSGDYIDRGVNKTNKIIISVIPMIIVVILSFWLCWLFIVVSLPLV